MLDKPLTTLTAAEQRTRQLAQTMHEVLVNHGECTRPLLLAEGFSRHELDQFGDAARALANHRFVRQVDEKAVEKPQSLAERMAAVIVAKVGHEESAVRALQRAGFTGTEIADHIDAANRLAGRDLVRHHMNNAQLVNLAYALGGMFRVGAAA
jgi:hypothetical protein